MQTAMHPKMGAMPKDMYLLDPKTMIELESRSLELNSAEN